MRKITVLAQRTVAAAALGLVALAAHAQAPLQEHATLLAAVGEQEPVRFVLTLPYRDPAAVEDFLARLYTPGDALFHQFLSSEEFTERFGPTREQYDALERAAQDNGLTLEQEHAGRTLLSVSAPAATIRRLFGVQMQRYRSDEGKEYVAPDGVALAPSGIAALGAAVAGLDHRPAHHHFR
ncbi:MAG TPA: protease pro-enzyme activation domain-containing protein, partial [Nevskiaceae bacterium]|nr:protease pro-enzyme activation domain-containing protein [Nevskiaceae bacterium]